MIADQYVEYRVVVDGKPCLNCRDQLGTHRAFVGAERHATYHIREFGEPWRPERVEIESRTITVTKWTTEVQP